MSSRVSTPERLRWWLGFAFWALVPLAPIVVVPQTVGSVLPAPPGKHRDTSALVALGETLFLAAASPGTAPSPVPCAIVQSMRSRTHAPFSVAWAALPARATRPLSFHCAYGRRFLWGTEGQPQP